MFVISVKTSWRQVLSLLGCVAVLAVAVVMAVLLPQPAAGPVGARVIDSADRLAYLRAQGFAIDEGSEEVREVRIPDEPDENLLQYDALQQEVGRSLQPYYGKRVRLYTYDIGETGTAHLLVYRDRVIAGDVIVDGDIQVIKGEA